MESVVFRSCNQESEETHFLQNRGSGNTGRYGFCLELIVSGPQLTLLITVMDYQAL